MAGWLTAAFLQLLENLGFLERPEDLSKNSNHTNENFLEDELQFLSFEGVPNVFLFITLQSNIWQVGSKENCAGTGNSKDGL